MVPMRPASRLGSGSDGSRLRSTAALCGPLRGTDYGAECAARCPRPHGSCASESGLSPAARPCIGAVERIGMIVGFAARHSYSPSKQKVILDSSELMLDELACSRPG